MSAPTASVATRPPSSASPAPADPGAAPPLLPSNDYLQSLEPASSATASSAARDAQDVGRLVGVCAAVGGLALATELNKGWIGSHQELAMTAVFVAGYAGIIVEEGLGLSKAAVALILAAGLWSIRATAEGLEALDLEMGSALGEVSAVIFFLLGAMTVVEVVDSHQGFKVITQSLRPASRTQLLLAVTGVTFVMSSVLDNLTTTIVMVALLNKLCPEPD
ncbi:hypothetical protein HYH02_001035 [Chlamydomonas schloesseri]|uniref:Citrate transporter-like domain-containing protein n=1 Tax=Chlamydomonas schloesseri TaxID=2026947 RepID=A0A835WWN7_9CHLO|nr:hypothetical protein HYH02_001035 [Chlamydomonas schloesseri]|eukprot:KAG2453991.1 hypothetical protein HYH02_001035 [Chlamydomonas schloesseri]